MTAHDTGGRGRRLCGLLLFAAGVLVIAPAQEVLTHKIPGDNPRESTAHGDLLPTTAGGGGGDASDGGGLSEGAATFSGGGANGGDTNAQQTEEGTAREGSGRQSEASRHSEALDTAPGDRAIPSLGLVSARAGVEALVPAASHGASPLVRLRARARTLMARLRSSLPDPNHPRARQRTPLGLNRYVLLSLYLMCAALMAHTFYGWAGLSNLLLRQGAFASQCVNQTHTCERQRAAVGALYSYGRVLSCFAFAGGGILYDVVGPRGLGLLGHALHNLGWTFLFLGWKGDWMRTVGTALIGTSVSLTVHSLIGVRALFPQHESTVMLLFGGALALGTVVPGVLLALVDSDLLDPYTVIAAYMFAVLWPLYLLAALTLPASPFLLSDDAEHPIPGARAVALGDAGGAEEFTGRRRRRGTGCLRRLLRRMATALRLDIIFSTRFVLVTAYRAISNIGAGFYNQAAGSFLPERVVRDFGFMVPLGIVSCVAMGAASSRVQVFRLLAVVSSMGFFMFVLALGGRSSWLAHLSALLMCQFVATHGPVLFAVTEELFGSELFPRVAGASVMVGGILGMLSTFLYSTVVVSWLGSRTEPVLAAAAVLFLLQFFLIYLMRRDLTSGERDEPGRFDEVPLLDIPQGGEDAADGTDTEADGEEDA